MDGETRVEQVLLPQNWGVVLLRGICAVIFGLLILDWPGFFIAFFVYLFGAFALIGGIFALGGGLFSRSGSGHRGMLLLQGALGIVVGIYVFCQPQITALILMLLIAIWAIVSGVFETGVACSLPGGTAGKGLLGVSGVISIIFGILVLSHPFVGLLAIVWIIGAYALVGGILLILLSFGLRSKKKAVL